MVVDLLIGLLGCVCPCGLVCRVVRVTPVKNALVVVSPGNAAELDLGQHLRVVLPGLKVSQVNVKPVRAGFRKAVSP